jgi:hypothetical protein
MSREGGGGGGGATGQVPAGEKKVGPQTGTGAVVLQLQMGIVENLRESDVPSRLCDKQKSVCSMKG